jgi:hypothetical protein
VGLALVATAAPAARAGLVLSGAITQISPPPSDIQDAPGEPQSNTTAFIWSERTGLTLSSPVSVDLTTTGTANAGNNYRPSPGTIAAGTKVDTYLLHSDPVGSGAQNYVFSITFDTKILGVIDTISGLAATDSTLGSPTTTYPGASTSRALELPDTLVWVSNNGLTLNFTTSTAVDEARILVVAVPEPSTAISGAMGAVAFLGFGWARRRRARMGSRAA